MLPALKDLHDTFDKKSEEFKAIVKIGRTHFLEAEPITLGQEFSAYSTQIEKGINALKNTLPDLQELPLGGTAVGTGLNSPAGFDDEIVNEISNETGLPFTKVKKNK